MNLKSKIRLVNNFPVQGVLYRDITTLLAGGEAFTEAILGMATCFLVGRDIVQIVGVEARGFILGAALAYELGIGFVPIRKAGKLPCKTESITYDTEYSQDTLEIHADAIKEGEKVLIVDDLLATGGTAKAAIELVERLGGTVIGIAVLVELLGLGGREKLGDVEVFSLIESGPGDRVKW